MNTGLSRVSTLTDEQRRAAQHPGGPLLVLAAPGSGKTRTMTARVQHLLEQGEDPRTICVATFSNKAADEFRHRLGDQLGQNTAARLTMGTLHSIAARKLRKVAHFVPRYNSDFTVCDQKRSLVILRQEIQELRLMGDQWAPLPVLEKICRYKEKLLPPSRLEPRTEEEKKLHQVYEAYQRRLREELLLDFGDLILHLVFLLEKHPELQKHFAYRWVMVDENQDTNTAQWRLLELLLDERRNLFAVADGDQLIFSFAGADPALLLGFPSRFPGATILSLSENFRSTQTIVNAAGAVIRNNTTRYDLVIHTKNDVGEPLRLLSPTDPNDEAESIASLIQMYHERGVPLSEIAVLYRTNQQSLPFEETLLARKIPFQVAGGGFFQRPEIRDVILWLRVIYNPEDREALDELVVRPNSGLTREVWAGIQREMEKSGKSPWRVMETAGASAEERMVSRIARFYQKVKVLREAARKSTFRILLDQVLTTTGLWQWYQRSETEGTSRAGISPIDNLRQLQDFVSRNYGNIDPRNIRLFLEHVGQIEEWSKESQGAGIILSTLHSAKGREWDIVFIAGAEEELLPHAKALELGKPAEIEEERRLFYVGMSRPRKKLILSACRHREVPGRGKISTVVSRFVREIPGEFLEG